MDRAGFTLVELLVVLATMGILFGIATFEFGQYSRKAGIESQIRTMYGDLMAARAQAFYEKKTRGVTITTSSFIVYSSTAYAGSPLVQRTLSYPVTLNGAGSIGFDSDGMVSVGNGSICVTDSNPGNIDSLIVSSTRIQMGKRTEGAACAATPTTNITVK